MEARAAYAGAGHREGEPDYVEVLADWAASWRRRVYKVIPSAELPVEARPGARQELEERTSPQMGEGLRPSTKSRSTGGRTQVRLSYSYSAAGECAAEAIFCCTTENSIT
jgi:hypothetical protein